MSSKSYQAVRSTPTTPRSTHASYHPKGYGVSEGLKRARQPFAVRNALTGAAILGFCVTVYTYSISKVKQDDFSDLADLAASSSTTQSASNPLLSSTSSSNNAASSSFSSSSSPSLATKVSDQASSIAKYLPSEAAQPNGTLAETARAEILRRQGRLEEQSQGLMS